MTKRARFNMAFLYTLGFSLVLEDVIEQAVKIIDFIVNTEASYALKVYLNYILGSVLDLFNAAVILYMFKSMALRLIER